MKSCNRKLQIPLEIIRFVYREKLVKPFAVYVYLKIHSDGKFNNSSALFVQLQLDLRIRDHRTMEKYLMTLKSMNWIGYDSNTGYYYVRGFDFIRRINNFESRTAVTFYAKFFNAFRSFLVGAIIGEQINKQRFYKEVAERRKLRAAVKKGHAAIQSKAFSSSSLPYYGLSNKRIAKLLGCNYTRASELKKQAVKDGFIKTRHRFKRLAVLSKRDLLLGPYLKDVHADSHKIRIARDPSNNGSITAYVQEMDEITPLLKYKTIRRLAA